MSHQAECFYIGNSPTEVDGLPCVCGIIESVYERACEDMSKTLSGIAIGSFVYAERADGSGRKLIQIILENGDKYDLRSNQ